MSEWLPSQPENDRKNDRAWKPRSLRRKNLDDFRYLLVDEIVGATVGLSLTDWPKVDDQGRIRFTGEPLLLGADADALKRFLDKHRRPRRLANRPVRIGDAFAVRVNTEALDRALAHPGAEGRLEPAPDPAEWIEHPIYDISGDAREQAKSSFYSAVTPRLAPREAERLREISSPGQGPPSWLPRRWPNPAGWPGRTLTLLAGATILSAGLGSGTAVGRISAPKRTVAVTTITQTRQLTTTLAAQTVTLPPTTITAPRQTITEPGLTITDAGATVTEAGSTTTATITAPTETVTTRSIVTSTIVSTQTSVQTTTLSQTTTTTVTTSGIRTLTVSISGREGRVVSKLLRIDCRRTWNSETRQSTESGRCTARVPTRARIDLQATPLAGGGIDDEEFIEWVTTCVGCPRNRLVFATAMRITARFGEPVG